MPAEFTLHRPSEDDWAAVRDLRIRAVTDAPVAFLESREQALAVDEAGWRARSRRNLESDGVHIVAVGSDGRWIGGLGAFITDGPPPYVVRREPAGRRANLVGVFVDPAWRGDSGVTGALIAAVAEWVAHDRGLGELFLHVSEANERARRSYLRRGFRETGVVDALADDPADRQVEMVATLPLPA